MSFVASFAVVLIVARWATELILLQLNDSYVQKYSGTVPEAFRGIFDSATYQRATEYTLAKGRFNRAAETYGMLVLVGVLFSGLLPSIWEKRLAVGVEGTWTVAIFLWLIAVALGVLSLPIDWYAQFRLEERFGFNSTTLGTWALDRLKGAGLSFVIGVPVFALVLQILKWAGPLWWLWAWVAVVLVQILLMLVAPTLIMPLFNKFTPLEPGPLRERLFSLAKRTGFPTRSLDVMDGSRRSRHSNAFFTGIGKFRRIVLFDTLVAQLSDAELEAVLAHEIGHYKKRHILKMLALSITGLLAAFATMAWLATQSWFVSSFGFEFRSGYSPADVVPSLLVCALLAGTITFWTAPFVNRWMRRFEYEADGYASGTLGSAGPLIGALRKLTEKNLSNLTPHPVYSAFYYSHPTLLERERALAGQDSKRA